MQKTKMNIWGLTFFLAAIACAPVSGFCRYALPDCNQVPLDEKLFQLMPFENGTFIEVGAHDGITQSNTKLLEECYGWTGVLVEPSPSLFDQLCASRPRSKCFQCALGSFAQDGTSIEGDFDGTLMASVHGIRSRAFPAYKVLMRSLQSILDEVKLFHINLFSLDVEGYELEILNGIDFNKTKFDYLLIEVYQHQYDKIVSFLADVGYDIVDSFSNYHLETNPGWDGTHNDYLFARARK